MSLEIDDALVAALRKQDPNGRRSTYELERIALRIALTEAVQKVEDENLRNILEAITELLTPLLQSAYY